MFRLDYMHCFKIILISFISVTWSQDRIIVSNLNLDETHSNSSLENDIIPERLLIQLKEVRNVSDLLQRFVAFNDDDDDPSLLGRNFKIPTKSRKYAASRRNGTDSARRGLSAVAASTIAQPANCQTEQHVIELDKPENGATLFWPSCIRVQRCGGCCTSKMLACKPLAISIVNVTVLQMHYNHQNPGSFESQGTKIFSLEQHDRCACTCKESPEDCNPNVHDYRAEECRCACKNAEQLTSCSAPQKIWDSRECLCKCRNIRMCSSGRYFNVLTCRCEILRRSLSIDNLNAQNRNTSLALQVSAASP